MCTTPLEAMLLHNWKLVQVGFNSLAVTHYRWPAGLRVSIYFPKLNYYKQVFQRLRALKEHRGFYICIKC